MSERTPSDHAVSERTTNRRTSNEFEFLRGLPFGPYLPVDSPIHRLDPRTRILLVVIFMVAMLAARHPLGLVLCLVIILAGWKKAQVPFKPLWRGWLSVLPLLLFLAALQVLFRVGNDADTLLRIGSLVISSADLWAGLAIILRFGGFMAILGLAAASLSESEITRGLEALMRPLSLLHIPIQDFVMAVQVTLRFFPLLAQSAERIAKAQASRGADWSPAGWNLVQRARQVMPVIVPLFVASLRRAENMALAMDTRGYGSLPVRTSVISLQYHREDVAILAGAVVVCLIVVVVI
jgi:energy-coupling factor transport system permease protein